MTVDLATLVAIRLRMESAAHEIIWSEIGAFPDVEARITRIFNWFGREGVAATTPYVLHKAKLMPGDLRRFSRRGKAVTA